MSAKGELIAAIQRVDGCPKKAAEELVISWIEGDPVHPSWHDKQEVMVALVALLQRIVS